MKPDGIQPSGFILHTMKIMFFLSFSLLALTAGFSQPAAISDAGKKMVTIPATRYTPFFRLPNTPPVSLPAFKMDETAVTNLEFLEFVKANPQWQKSRVNRLFADSNYLKHWESDLVIGEKNKEIFNSPVVNVSWFAAKAYAAWKGKRLPTVAEWETAGAADMVNSKFNNLTDQILNWYTKPNEKILPNIKTAGKNAYGLYDMHGLIWEWTFDFNSFIKSGDSRANTQDELKLFCASSSLYVKDKSDYASFLRFSYRGSLKGNFCIANLGFRCARD